MKSAVFAPTLVGFMGKYIFRLATEMQEPPIIYCSNQDDFDRWVSQFEKFPVEFDAQIEYFSRAGDPRIYKGFLDYCEEQSIENAIIPRLLWPELLESEMRVRQDSSVGIFCALFGTTDSHLSPARASSYARLLHQEQFKKLLVHSISGTALGQSPQFLQATANSSKVVYCHDPLYDPEESYKSGPGQQLEGGSDPMVLFFGSLFYGKGIDILQEALGHVRVPIRITVAGDPNTINFDFSSETLRNNPRVDFIDHYVSDEDMFELFRRASLVVLPYRKTYTHDTSGVFVQAASAGKPILVPDIPPFSDVLKERPNIGSLFRPEDPKDLAQSIESILSGDFEYDDGGYMDSVMSWAQICSAYFD